MATEGTVEKETVEKKPQTFRCMMCGNAWEEEVQKAEDKERACPECRPNSVRMLKRRP